MTQTPAPDLPPYTPADQAGGPTQKTYGAPAYGPTHPNGSGPTFGAGQPLAPSELPWRAAADDNTWALLSHLGGIFILFIAPLIVLLTKGKESGYVRNQAVEALNWTITITIGYAISGVLTVVLVGYLTYFACFVAAVVFGIIATIAASKGETYKYPWALRLVK